MKFETKYSVGEKVVIIDLENAKAVIRQICISDTGMTYQINWFHDGERRDAWVFEDEIAPR